VVRHNLVCGDVKSHKHEYLSGPLSSCLDDSSVNPPVGGASFGIVTEPETYQDSCQSVLVILIVQNLKSNQSVEAQ
jgi:hypothetical protein